MKHLIALLIFMVGVLQLHAAHPIVILETTQGTIELELYEDVAPLAVENFATHVENGYYDGIAFHRIIDGFVIQGGDPTETGRGGASIWKKPFKDEFGPNVVFDRPGILAMANRGPMTNGSQFFITLAPTNGLNGRHTIFGHVTAGMDTVKKLGTIPTNGRSGGNRPLVRQEIIKAYLKQDKKP